MQSKDETLGARFETEIVERIDAHLERVAKQSPAGARKLTRSDAIRNLVERGLAEAERRSGTVRGDAKSGTKREA